MSLLRLACVLVLAALGCGDKRSPEAEPAPPPQAPAPVVAVADAAPPPFRVTELSPDALVVTTEPFASNSLLVRTAAGTIILVDTPMTPHDTAVLLDWIEERWGAVPGHALASHWHADASGGNQVLVERGVEVISSAHTARLVADKGAAGRDELVAMLAEDEPETVRELAAMRPTPATRTIDVQGRANLELGGETVVLLHPAPSHSADSIGIWFPDRELLYGGCTVRSNGRIINKSEADADGWVRTLEAFAALEPETVIPGHGARFDPAMIPESIEAAKQLDDH